MYDTVKTQCINFLRKEKEYFRSFIEVDGDLFDNFISRLRLEGGWGTRVRSKHYLLFSIANLKSMKIPNSRKSNVFTNFVEVQYARSDCTIKIIIIVL